MMNMEGGKEHQWQQRRVFATTRWSLVRRATTSNDALEEWVSSCWYPLYTWARHQQWSPEDAADAVQDFLGKVCTRNLLASVDPARGKFRSWLLTSFSNHLASGMAKTRSRKRGGGQLHMPLDVPRLEQIYHNEMSCIGDPTQAYTRAWAITLMDEALLRLEEYFKARCQEEMFQVLLPALEGPLPETTFHETAARLGMTGPALRQAAVRFRQRYRRCLLDVASERLGITCEARLAEELRELLGN